MALCSMGPRQITGASSWVRKPIDTIWMPNFSAGRICLPLLWSCSDNPNMMGTLGPWMSPSSTPTRAPNFESATARFTATVVLPTPPLPAPTAITFFTPGSGGPPFSGAVAERTTAVMATSTAVTPGSAATASRACAWSWSFTGHAGVVSSMVNATRPPSMTRFFTKPSETMFFWRSGSITTLSASRTDWEVISIL